MRGSFLGIYTVTALLLACGDGSPCRDSGDCRGDLECSGPSEPQVCGISAMQACSSDVDCGDSERCHAVYDPCSPDGLGSACRPPCAPGECGDELRCSDEGACEPIPCDEGYACESYQACDPSAAGDDPPIWALAHGCVSISCSSDDACPSGGACVNGVCQSGPGTCVEVTLVP